MRLPISISLLLIIAGTGLLIYAAKFPVYTDKTAPERISDELYPPMGALKPHEMDARFSEWFSRLRAYETLYKRLSDLGRGLCAAGAGLLFASCFWVSYFRYSWMRTTRVLFLLWLILWAARIPLSIWYYALREQRFDYPVWGDSIAIGIFSDTLTWIIGAAVSSLVLAMLVKGHPLPATILLSRPHSVRSWLCAAFFTCWIAFLAFSVICGIPDGDEGVVFTSIIASVVLLVFFSACKDRKSEKIEMAISTS